MEIVIDLSFVRSRDTDGAINRECLGIYRNFNEIENHIEQIEQYTNQEIEDYTIYNNYNEFYFEIYYRTIGDFESIGGDKYLRLTLDELKKMIRDKSTKIKAEFGKKRRKSKKI